MEPKQKACPWFQKGSCKKGAGCPDLHGGMPAAAYVAAVSSGKMIAAATSPGPSIPATPPRPPPASVQGSAARPASAQRGPRGGGGGGGCNGASGIGGGGAHQRPASAGRRPWSSQHRDGGGNGGSNASGGAPAGGALMRLPLGSGAGAARSLGPAFSAAAPGALVAANGSIVSSLEKRTFGVNLGRGSSAVVQVQQALVTSKPPLVVHAYFLIDASGSMSGERMNATLEHVNHMCRDVLEPNDLVTVWLFSAELKLEQLYYKTRAGAISPDALQARVKAGGCTMLYDNTARAIECMAKDGDVRDARGNTILRNLVVFTDGADNKSAEGGLAAMVARVRAPGVANFHFTCLAVGKEAAEEGDKLREALKGCRHAKVIMTATASKEDIAGAFGKAQACLRAAKTVLVEQLQIQCRSSNPAESVLGRALVSGVAGLTLGSGGSGGAIMMSAASSGGGGRASRSATPSRGRSRTRS
ncbi:hypothetical protein GPECTOR_15g422 [Gonium pectorale]|uniref:C3H1-type domain-containing protein n=1 Tax=Gonium pectorale TaxID=33097 RepID=A0A150GLR4_GONPE|nr:hypothetical protein GPECTOR_15g422 [Gonium pectorale]|eukprot:KXZ50737.1 hypothetical protein GPECTOR_15g422 [Gonium pectorale]